MKLLFISITYVSYRFLDNPYFIEWQQKIADCARSGVNLKRLSDSRFRKNVLPNLSDKVLLKQKQDFNDFDYWTVSIDEWKDCSRQSYYAVMLVNNSSQIYLGNITPPRGNSDNIRLGIKDIILPYIGKIRAIVTDSPNVMVKMRNDLHKELTEIIPIRCPLYAINLWLGHAA